MKIHDNTRILTTRSINEQATKQPHNVNLNQQCSNDTTAVVVI